MFTMFTVTMAFGKSRKSRHVGSKHGRVRNVDPARRQSGREEQAIHAAQAGTNAEL
jgi:hypothetical protein